MNYFFISDTHLLHANIIRYEHRPWLREGDLDSTGNWISSYVASERGKEMTEAIKNNWNKRVKPEDKVIHIGDFGFGRSTEAPDSVKSPLLLLKEQLNGDMILISGNHDRNNGAKSIIESMVIDIGGFKIWCVHNPKFARPEYKLNFTGHEHGKFGIFNKLGEKSTIVDLSVENWNYMPVSINEILAKWEQWKRSKHG